MVRRTLIRGVTRQALFQTCAVALLVLVAVAASGEEDEPKLFEIRGRLALKETDGGKAHSITITSVYQRYKSESR